MQCWRLTSGTFDYGSNNWGKRYKIKWKDLGPDTDGNCDSPNTKNKTIRLSTRIRNQPTRLMETLHVADEWVKETAQDITLLLKRFQNCNFEI